MAPVFGRPSTDPGSDAMGGAHTFLGMQIDSWVKVVLAWITAMIIGGAGWFLHIRDSLAERATTSAVETKIDVATKPIVEKVTEHHSDIRGNAMSITLLQISSAKYVEIQNTQTKLLEQRGLQLDNIQKDIKKILYHQRNDEEQ